MYFLTSPWDEPGSDRRASRLSCPPGQTNEKCRCIYIDLHIYIYIILYLYNDASKCKHAETQQSVGHSRALLHHFFQQLSTVGPKSMPFGGVSIEGTHPKRTREHLGIHSTMQQQQSTTMHWYIGQNAVYIVEPRCTSNCQHLLKSRVHRQRAPFRLLHYEPYASGEA